jgi:hypothetical protein
MALYQPKKVKLTPAQLAAVKKLNAVNTVPFGQKPASQTPQYPNSAYSYGVMGMNLTVDDMGRGELEVTFSGSSADMAIMLEYLKAHGSEFVKAVADEAKLKAIGKISAVAPTPGLAAKKGVAELKNALKNSGVTVAEFAEMLGLTSEMQEKDAAEKEDPIIDEGQLF